MPAIQAPSGEQLRAQRVAAGLTQQQLAELADCSLSYVGMLEAGMTPRGATPVLRRLADALENDASPAGGPGSVNDPAVGRPSHVGG